MARPEAVVTPFAAEQPRLDVSPIFAPMPEHRQERLCHETLPLRYSTVRE